MHKVGILSDTHGLLRPEVMDALVGCEAILHAGDINKQSILDQLETIASVHVVRGNNDKEWAENIPEQLQLNIFGISVFMIHNKKYIPKNLEHVDLVIYGHSHKYDDHESEGIHYLNPGSCGPRRFDQEITASILYIEEDGSYWIEKIIIPNPAKEKKTNRQKTEKMLQTLPEQIPAIVQDIDAGKSVKQIARKYRLTEELSEQICRMYLTHPGVDTEGILSRLGM